MRNLLLKLTIMVVSSPFAMFALTAVAEAGRSGS